MQEILYCIYFVYYDSIFSDSILETSHRLQEKLILLGIVRGLIWCPSWNPSYLTFLMIEGCHGSPRSNPMMLRDTIFPSVSCSGILVHYYFFIKSINDTSRIIHIILPRYIFLLVLS